MHCWIIGTGNWVKILIPIILGFRTIFCQKVHHSMNSSFSWPVHHFEVDMEWFLSSIPANNHKHLSWFVHSSFYFDHYEAVHVLHTGKHTCSEYAMQSSLQLDLWGDKCSDTSWIGQSSPIHNGYQTLILRTPQYLYQPLPGVLLAQLIPKVLSFLE